MKSETELRENLLREKLEDLNRKILIMQWDYDRHQLNAGKIPLFNELKEEKERIEQELNSILKDEDVTEQSQK